MRIEQQWTGEVLTLSLRGKLNTDEQREVLRTTVEQLVGQGHRKVVLDLGLKQARSRHASRSKRDDAGPSLTRRRAGVPGGSGCSR